MIDEEGNEIDDELWAEMMEAYAEGFVSGGGGDGGVSDEAENADPKKARKSAGKKAAPDVADFPEDIPF